MHISAVLLVILSIWGGNRICLHITEQALPGYGEVRQEEERKLILYYRVIDSILLFLCILLIAIGAFSNL